MKAITEEQLADAIEDVRRERDALPARIELSPGHLRALTNAISERMKYPGADKGQQQVRLFQAANGVIRLEENGALEHEVVRFLAEDGQLLKELRIA